MHIIDFGEVKLLNLLSIFSLHSIVTSSSENSQDNKVPVSGCFPACYRWPLQTSPTFEDPHHLSASEIFAKTSPVSRHFTLFKVLF